MTGTIDMVLNVQKHGDKKIRLTFHHHNSPTHSERYQSKH